MASSLRLIRKVYRFEIASMTIAILLLTAAAVVITTHLDAFRPTLACWNQYVTSDGEISAGCEGLQGWLRAHGEASQIKGALTFLPLISGALLGSVLVSREIEQRTTQLAWSLSGARRRWLVERVLPVALVLSCCSPSSPSPRSASTERPCWASTRDRRLPISASVACRSWLAAWARSRWRCSWERWSGASCPLSSSARRSCFFFWSASTPHSPMAPHLSGCRRRISVGRRTSSRSASLRWTRVSVVPTETSSAGTRPSPWRLPVRRTDG